MKKFLTLSLVLLALTSCAKKGDRGSIGPQGPIGLPGTPAINCTVQQAVNGAFLTCPNGSTLILNGTDGADGLPAQPTAYSIAGIVDPCSDAANIHDEVLLQLVNGALIASFSDNAAGLNTRFSLLTAGSYSTTDGSNCHFSVSNTNVVTW